MNVAHISIKLDGLQRRNPHALTLTAMVRSFFTHQNVGAHDRVGAFGRIEGMKNRAQSLETALGRATIVFNSNSQPEAIQNVDPLSDIIDDPECV